MATTWAIGGVNVAATFIAIAFIDKAGRRPLLLAGLVGMGVALAVVGLAFLSIDGVYRAMGYPGRDPANPKFSDHCFTGAYPTGLTDQNQPEPQPRQLSLLAEAS